MVQRKKIPLSGIRTDGDTQPRCELDLEVVAEYALAYKGAEGDDIPDPDVVHDGTVYWLWDGFHRYFGAKDAGLTHLWCRVRQGSLKDARWLAAGANKTHGLKRSTEDKRRAVEMAIAAEPDSTDRAIAEHCGVTAPTVAATRKRLDSTVKILQSHTTEKSDVTGEIPQSTPQQPTDPESGKSSGTPKTKPATRPRKGKDGRTINTANIGKGRTKKTKPEPAEPPSEEQRQTEAQKVVEQWSGVEASANGALADSLLTDSVGLPVPESLRPTFEVLPQMDALEQALKVVQKGIAAIAILPGAEEYRTHLGRKGKDEESAKFYCEHVKNALAKLKWARPHASVCPYCHHDHADRLDPACKACGGRGWVTETVWDRTPEDYKESALADAREEREEATP